MHTFDTPEPISVTVELSVGDVRIEASDRTDTVVEVRPSDPDRKSDVAAARQTRVDFSGGRLVVKTPSGWRPHAFFGRGESVDVHIELPSGSQVRGDAAVATIYCAGRLGDCDFKTSAGDIHVAWAAAVQLKSSVGDITLDHADRADVRTASGAVRVARIDGTGVVKNSNGETWIGEISGDLRASSANGSIVVESARGSVAAKTANGDIRLGEVQRGPIVAETARGKVEVGVAEGVAAWLELKTQFGRVQSNLEAAAQPEAGEDTVEVRARTAFGDITINRAPANGARRSAS